MGSVSVEDIDVDFLALIYDIIKCVERENTESAQAKRSEFQESSQKIQEFHRKLDVTRDQIRKLPGIDYSKEDQIKKLEALRKQLVLKKKLLQKYKDMCALEGVKQYLNPSNAN
ncbi:Mediator of RNA polymerase II transcription subunit 9 [Orchesella cincta]|uniref:Mediator of RNA polymerase II transcription subunit 9 n=1 Tax=Orchesella cincta TaxID=48709 RepID=A0A1D2NLF0_ORCCI|nr:Mediator of RNA polymerase II transcription subunit 9 [Orchesella cincta]